MAYHSQLDALILFGGYEFMGDFYLAGTWIFDDTDWVPLGGTESPGPRRGMTMITTTPNYRPTLFGGLNGVNTYSET